tara:strand:+ start:28800 stop:30026 length:1227 start_codon:yes stop_codon:yes gene_type:complete
LAILRNPTFLLFFLGNVVSLVGFGFNLVAVSWLVIQETGSEFALGKVMAISTFPGLLIAVFSGFIIDKMNRKWLLVFLDLYRFLVILLFLIALEYQEFTINLIYPLAIFMGIGNSIFWPTAQAFAQEIVSKKDYFPANALLSASYQFGSIIGAGVGGLIVHFYDPFTTLTFNAMAYIISGILIYFAPFKKKSKNISKENILTEVGKGFGYLKKKKSVLLLGLTTIMSDVAIWGSLSVLTIALSKNIFNAGSWGYGIMDGFYGIGALLSTLFIGTLISIFSRKWSLLGFYFIAGTMSFMSPLMPSIVLAGIAYFFMGLANNSARIIIRTIFMENIENKIMGRVQTIFGVYTRIMVVTSAIFAGWIVESSSTANGMFFAAGHYLIALIGIIILITNRKNVDILINGNKDA